MILALLDHPWPLEEALAGSSLGFRVLEDFERLVRIYGLEVVPFINRAEYEQVWTRLDYQRYSRTSGLAALRRFAYQLVRSSDGHCRALPNPLPEGLSEEWRCSLREAAVVTDWRNPQIIVARTRKANWPDSEEVEIRFDPCDNEPALPPDRRVLAILDSYERHRFARSDFDPWDLQHIHPPSPDAAQHMQHTCCLPKPPMEHAGLDHVDAELAKVRRDAWGRIGRYYFVPPTDWRFGTVSREAWRQGRAFPYRRCENSDRSGYVDFEGREWVWDQYERHWDVQTNPYLRVTNTGDLLD
jgi:hypothetical protein